MKIAYVPNNDKNRALQGDGQIYLLGEGSRRSDFECLQEIMVSRKSRLKHKHASIEVRGGPRAQLMFGPGNLVRGLLAVPDLVLRSMAPCLLTKAVHDSVEVTIWKVE